MMKDVPIKTYQLKDEPERGTFQIIDSEDAFYIPEQVFNVLRSQMKLETRSQFFALIHDPFWIKDEFEDQLGWSLDDLKKAIEKVEHLFPHFAIKNFAPKQHSFGALIPKDFKPRNDKHE